MANTTFLKLNPNGSSYVETGTWQSTQRGSTAFVEFQFPGTNIRIVRYWSRPEAIPLNEYMRFAISKRADDTYNIALALHEADPYIYWYATPPMGSSAGRPESEVVRYGPNDASGTYFDLQYKDPSDATWHPWRSLNCDYGATNMTDWRVNRVSSTSWYSEHLPAAGSGCE